MIKNNTPKYIGIFLFIFLASTPTAHAQMGGSNYTIDSSAAATATNFKTWFSFWRSLQGQSRNDGGSTLGGGISSSVTVLVKSDLTDTSIVKFPFISGTSSTKTITINGNGKYFACNKAGEIFSFQGGDYITIKNLTIRHLGSNPAAAICVRLYNNSDNNTIQNCTLEFANLSTAATDGSAYVAFCASANTLNTTTTTVTGTNNIIKGNLCRTTNSNSPGPAFAFVMNGTNTGYTTNAQNNTFDSNTVQNFYATAVQALYGNGNQFIYNNISRANASTKNCNSTLLGFNLEHSYSGNRSFKISNNIFHDIPYVGAGPSTGVSNLSGITASENHGSKNFPFEIIANNFNKLYSTDDINMAYLRNSDYLKITQNVLDKMQGYNTVGSCILWDISTGDELDFSNNTVTNCELMGKSSSVVYIDNITAASSGYTTANNNTFQNNNFFYECNVFYANYSNWKVRGNKVLNNTITGKNGGYMFCILLEEFESAEITNNLVANNIGEDGVYGIVGSSFNSSATSCDVHQNTIYLDGTTITSGAYDINGLFLTPYFQADISVSGNIVALKEGNSGSIIGVDAASGGAVKLMDNNTYHIQNVGSQTWFLPGVGVSDFANWILLTGVGAGESFINPKFTNIGNNDFKPKQWQLQNNVSTLSFNLTDIDGNPRNSKRSDRGAYEQIADVKAVSSPFSINAKVCSGLQKKVSIKIQNLYVDTVTNFNVSYSVGNSTKTSQKVTKKLAPNDTTTITFTAPMSLNQWGSVKINIFVDVPDDKTSNDTLKFSTFLDPAPGGGKLTPGAQPTKAIYSTNSNPDVIVVGEPLYYYLGAPRAYTNVDYGTKWTATAWAVTVPGNTSISGWTYYSPISTSDQYVKFLTSNSNLEDSLIKVCFKVTDIGNGCDTTNCRFAKIAPMPKAAFTAPVLVCGNDTAQFINKSSIKSGSMRYHWNFGTGNPADTSDKADPQFVYKTNGTFKVKLTAYSQPYGFSKTDSVMVNVNQKPKAAFTKTNACEKENNTFTNQSTPTGGTNKWVITGYPTATTKDLIVKFSAPGQYNVTLYNTYNGCVDSITQKAFQFNTPVADFSAPAGQCSNSVIQFTNKGKLTSGTFASYWNFGNGQTSKSFEPTHTFGTLGSASVKLLLISDLGCKDSVTKTLSLKQSPAIDFIHSEACSIDSTTFKNQTPPVPATTPSFKWSFGDGTTSTAENPYHFWKTIGVKNVKLIISLSNGCKDSLSKLLTVKTQPKVAFTDNSPVCYGSKVNFNNGTTWAQGSVNYDWNFGDASNSDKSDPSYQYSTNITKTYNVTLCADVNGACKTCFVKPVTVNAIPGTCDFEASPDYAFGYYGMKCIPKNASTGALGQQFGVTYKWNFENSGFQTQDTGRYNFQTDGSYSVTMCAEFGSTSCSCCVTKQVRMDRTPIAAFKHENVRIYPNPNAGKFQIELPESQLLYTVTLYDMGGKLVYKTQLQGNTAEINSMGFGAGIYLLKAENGQNSFRAMVEITD